MKRNAVFFGDRKTNRIDFVYDRRIKENLEGMVNLYDAVVDRENLQEHASALELAEVAFSTWGMPPFTGEEIRKHMPGLKAVFYAAGSVQGFARPFLENGVKVSSAWHANGVPVAEYTLAQIILANKGFFQIAALAKRDYAQAQKISGSFPGNYNIKVGLLGAGVIGARVAELLKPLDLEVLVFDPFLSRQRAKELGVGIAGLEEIFSSCQTISNHLANVPATVGMLNKTLFDRMPENATFINTGRGAQVVEKDLALALAEVPTRTAVLDVTSREPLESGNPLLALGNVFLTPHIAGSGGKEVTRMGQYMLDEFLRYERGEELRYNVTVKMLETMA